MGEWTTDTALAFILALKEADQRFDAERDRRYSEVAAARAEALKIKDEGDKEALRLAREIQVYKDEKANELREQINQERGHYVTHTDLKSAIDKIETAMKPLGAYMTSQQGRSGGFNAGWIYFLGVFGLLGTGVTILGGVVTIAVLFLKR